MQQRRLRLGDIVDDYCPRERRITNHAVVAMIEDEVKQTRCTTCDADHEYKQARVPAQRRKKDSPSGLPADAAAGVPRKRPAEAAEAAEAVDAPDTAEAPEHVVPDLPESVPSQAVASEAASSEEADAVDPTDIAEPARPEDEGPVHRRLIRATLPRPEGQVPERKMPDFTMHQREANGNRPGRVHRRGPRPGQMRTQQGNGQPPRFGGPRQGPRQGPGHGGGQGQQGNRSGHGTGQGHPGQHRPNRPGGGRKRGR
jgi:hypothetical protein